jgi:hypothetical protein
VSDGQGFDRLSRKLANPVSRRGVFKAAGVAAGGAVAATVLRPFRASASAPTPASCIEDLGPGATPCGPICCTPGTTCVDASNGVCSCPGGTQTCGLGCCPATCSQSSTSCCCPTATTPCGTNCCNRGVACLDAGSGLCGCPARTTPCGSGAGTTCCPAGQACTGGCTPVNSTANRTACCRGYQAPCTVGGDCCSGVCSSFKGNRCGCTTDADCPKNAPRCNGGFCGTTAPPP